MNNNKYIIIMSEEEIIKTILIPIPSNIKELKKGIVYVHSKIIKKLQLQINDLVCLYDEQKENDENIDNLLAIAHIWPSISLLNEKSFLKNILNHLFF